MVERFDFFIHSKGLKRHLFADLLSKMPIVYTNGTGEYLSKQIDSMAVLESAVFVVRQEYANPYWVLIDMIDIYLTLNQTGKLQEIQEYRI